MYKLYDELSNWWSLLSPHEEYADEAAFFGQIFQEADLPISPTLLELGSGGGSNAYYLKVEHEQHICGLFPRAEWLWLLQEVGFQPEIIRDPCDRDILVAHKPKDPE